MNDEPAKLDLLPERAAALHNDPVSDSEQLVGSLSESTWRRARIRELDLERAD